MSKSAKTHGSILNAKIAHEMCGAVLEVCEKLGLAGNFMVGDLQQNPLACIRIGNPRPTTFSVAHCKGKQAVHTGAPTDVTKDALLETSIEKARSLELYGLKMEGLTPFGGGCPIVSPEGELLGWAAFSEQTANTDKEIVKAVIKKFGYLSEYPKMNDYPADKIRKAFELE